MNAAPSRAVEPRLGKGRHAGVLVPLFSIPSTRSWGIGEVGDIVPLSRWLRRAGQDLLQLLPLSEMAPGEHSPYGSLSAMAIDPIFIGLADLEDFAALGAEASLDEGSRVVLATLRAGRSVDYRAVRDLKMRALRAAFHRFHDSEWGRRTTRARALAGYIEEQAWWLEDYALFRALKAQSGERSWLDWPEDLRARDPRALRRARSLLAGEILFRQYLQWVADGQWRRARERVAPVRVVGDLPFGVGEDSADVWTHQESFDLTRSVGAPPDPFNEEGQDWGLPAYRWSALGLEGYAWLRGRARRVADLYDLYRVDHAVGYYRTYVRPRDGSPPHFVPADEREQVALGEEMLRLFQEAGAPVLAEDLGTVPEFVRASLGRLGVPGYLVLRWERQWQAEGQPFRDPTAYPAASVATSGTHDTASMADWWDALSPEERRQACLIPALRCLPEDLASSPYGDRVRDALLEALFHSGSDLVILPVQDIFGWRDRINVPATVSDENWTYRLPWSSDRLEAEAGAIERAEALRLWSERSGRAPVARPR